MSKTAKSDAEEHLVHEAERGNRGWRSEKSAETVGNLPTKKNAHPTPDRRKTTAFLNSFAEHDTPRMCRNFYPKPGKLGARKEYGRSPNMEGPSVEIGGWGRTHDD